MRKKRLVVVVSLLAVLFAFNHYGLLNARVVRIKQQKQAQTKQTLTLHVLTIIPPLPPPPPPVTRITATRMTTKQQWWSVERWSGEQLQNIFCHTKEPRFCRRAAGQAFSVSFFQLAQHLNIQSAGFVLTVPMLADVFNFRSLFWFVFVCFFCSPPYSCSTRW